MVGAVLGSSRMSKGKKAAAQALVEFLTPLLGAAIEQRGRVVLGIGTGSTMAHVMDALHRARQHHHWQPHQLIGIPTSYQSQQLILSAGMLMGSLAQFPRIDFAIDGADEIDASGRFIIKGGGGALFMEKLVASAAEQFIIIADESKYNDMEGRLGVAWKGGIPLAVYPDAEHLVGKRIAQQRPTLYHIQTRVYQGGKIGPVISDQGHLLMDLHLVDDTAFSDNLTHFVHIDRLAAMLDSTPGIIAHGLFIDMASMIILGNNDTGTTRTIKPTQNQ